MHNIIKKIFKALQININYKSLSANQTKIKVHFFVINIQNLIKKIVNQKANFMISYQKIQSCSLAFSSFWRLATNKKLDFVDWIKRASTFSWFVLYLRDLVDNLHFFTDLPKNPVCQLNDFWVDRLKDFDFSNQTKSEELQLARIKLNYMII